MKVKSVLVPGKFQVIHSGHIRLFRMAKQLGERTIIALDHQGLSKDEILWRKRALLGLNLIDQIEVFDTDISELVLRLKPKIILKGMEFSTQDNAEVSILNSYGGKLMFSSGPVYYSESDLILENPIQSNLKFDVNRYGNEFFVRNKIGKDKLLNSLQLLKKIRTCVIGDLIVDEIINCHPIGMSQEDPSIAVTPIDSKKFIGGAGIVAGHCSSLGSKTTFVTVLGQDSTSDWAVKQLRSMVDDIRIIRDDSRATNLKQRFKSGKQNLLKLNHFTENSISKSTENKILKFFEANVSQFDLLILSDFSFGVISNLLAQRLIHIAQKAKIFVASDSQTSSQLGNLSKFKGSDLITPTELEARLEIRDTNCGLVVLAENLMKLMETKNILLKLGPDGVLLHGSSRDNEVVGTDQVPALNKNAIDVSGAGDSMLAASALLLSSGENLYVATYLASIVAAVQVSRLGNVPVSIEEIQSVLNL